MEGKRGCQQNGGSLAGGWPCPASKTSIGPVSRTCNSIRCEVIRAIMLRIVYICCMDPTLLQHRKQRQQSLAEGQQNRKAVSVKLQ